MTAGPDLFLRRRQVRFADGNRVPPLNWGHTPANDKEVAGQ